jgi:hypothetical protein
LKFEGAVDVECSTLALHGGYNNGGIVKVVVDTIASIYDTIFALLSDKNKGAPGAAKNSSLSSAGQHPTSRNQGPSPDTGVSR